MLIAGERVRAGVRVRAGMSPVRTGAVFMTVGVGVTGTDRQAVITLKNSASIMNMPVQRILVSIFASVIAILPRTREYAQLWIRMPIITVPGHGSIEATEGQRLVNALEEGGVDIGHRCGGYARCTTCRVRFTSGEPKVITYAEYDKLLDRNLMGEARLACQIIVEEDMTVVPLMLVSQMGWSDPGPTPEETVMPEPEWRELD